MNVWERLQAMIDKAPSTTTPKKPGRPRGRKKTKVSVTLDSGLVRIASKKAAKEKRTLSSLVQSALSNHLQNLPS